VKLAPLEQVCDNVERSCSEGKTKAGIGKNSERWLNHGGGMNGGMAIVNVGNKRAVIVLSNLGNAHKPARNTTA
jgi:hypothetical protein